MQVVDQITDMQIIEFLESKPKITPAINKEINRLDIQKDAIVEPNATTDQFNASMATIFPGVNVTNFMNQLNRIKDDIKKTPNFGPTKPRIISSLKKPGSTNNYITEVQKAWHDSGYNPSETVSAPVLTNIGSRIDLGPRQKAVFTLSSGIPNFYPAVGKPIVITPTLFEYFGFPRGLTFRGIMNPDYTCNVEWTLGEIKVGSKRDVGTFKHISSGIDYFSGNREKNAAILANNDTNEAIKWALSKEFGDFLQLLFIIIYLIQTGDVPMTYCLFTADNVLAARARSLGVPCCVTYREGTKDSVSDDGREPMGKLHKVEYWTGHASQEEQDSATKLQFRNQCIANNGKITRDINKALTGTLLLGGNKIDLNKNPQVRAYLNAVVESIGRATTFITTYENSDLEGFKKMAIICSALSLVTEKGKISQSVTRLFQKEILDNPGLSDIDFIVNNRTRFNSTAAQQINSLIRARGGRKTRRGREHRTRKGGALGSRSYVTQRKTIGKVVHTPFTKQNVLGNYTRMLKNTLGVNKTRINKVNIGKNYDMENYRYILETSYDDNTLSKDFFTVVTSIIPGSIMTKNLLAEDFLYSVFNYITFIEETPLDEVILKELYRMSITNYELSDLTLDEFKAKYESMKGGMDYEK